MSSKVKLNLLYIFLFLALNFAIWVFHQEKNFIPVFKYENSLSLRSDKNLAYSELSSSIELLEILNEKFPEFKLNPSVKNRDFSVLGRVFNDGFDEVGVYEYETPFAAKKDYEKFLPNYGSRLILYKNFIVLTGSKNEVMVYLKERLK